MSDWKLDVAAYGSHLSVAIVREESRRFRELTGEEPTILGLSSSGHDALVAELAPTASYSTADLPHDPPTQLQSFDGMRVHVEFPSERE